MRSEYNNRQKRYQRYKKQRQSPTIVGSKNDTVAEQWLEQHRSGNNRPKSDDSGMKVMIAT